MSVLKMAVSGMKFSDHGFGDGAKARRARADDRRDAPARESRQSVGLPSRAPLPILLACLIAISGSAVIVFLIVLAVRALLNWMT